MAGSSMIRMGTSVEEEREVKEVYLSDTFVTLFNDLCVVDLHILVLMNHKTVTLEDICKDTSLQSSLMLVI